jgi:hypothetical protein
MKIKSEHLETMRAAMIPTMDRFPRSSYPDISDVRYRWDILRATGLKIGDSIGMPGDIPLYDYLNDDHIDTALRSIVKSNTVRSTK